MADITLYNTLTRAIETVKPLHKGKIGLYTCGPTVYDHAHIGNLRTYLFEDTLRRTLKLSGYEVKHVMNITDIEDKIFARAREQGIDYTELTRQYEKVFFEDVSQLGIDLEDSTIIRATDAIEDMQALIAKIPNKYIAEDGVYFDIAQYPEYGIFEKLDRSHEHHRINNDEYDKDHVADFALWKTQKAGEPSWDFELEGKNIAGRPGWHIECSAMSTKYLGQPFDIHTGGVDLKFPHHENEIAQSKAATGKDLATMFVHAEHLLVGGKKMSKSLKNFYTLKDIVAKGFDPLVFRLLVLQAHYRSQLNFSWESMAASQQALKDMHAWADLQFQAYESAVLKKYYDEALIAFQSEMREDLKTPTALAVFNHMIHRVDELGADTAAITQALTVIEAFLGIGLTDRQDINSDQKALITERERARGQQDWSKSDKLRQKLLEEGVEIKDTAHGPIWSRV